MEISERLLKTYQLPDRETLQDLVLISSVPGCLVVLHLVLSESTKSALAFDHEAVNIWGLYTSALVHDGYEHLIGNLAAYFLAAGAAYWLCTRASVRAWYKRSVVLLLLLLPPLTVTSSYLLTGAVVPDSMPAERGFSGVASGFAGFLWVTLIVYVGERQDYQLGINLGIAILICLLLEVGFVHSGLSNPIIYLLGVAGIGLLLGSLAWQRGLGGTFPKITIRTADTVIVPAFGAVSLAVLVYGMFPPSLVVDGSFVNVFAHFAGFAWAIPIVLSAFLISR